MRYQELQEHLERQPFYPIRLHMSDGSKVEIRHPEMVILGRNTITVGEPSDEPKVADRIRQYSLVHVVQVEQMQEA